MQIELGLLSEAVKTNHNSRWLGTSSQSLSSKFETARTNNIFGMDFLPNFSDFDCLELEDLCGFNVIVIPGGKQCNVMLGLADEI